MSSHSFRDGYTAPTRPQQPLRSAHAAPAEDLGEEGELLRRLRRELLDTEDTVCLDRARIVTEAYRTHANDPVPLLRAKAFRTVLLEMKLDLLSNPFFAGNTSSSPRAWMLLPEYGFEEPPQVVLENAGLQGILSRSVPEEMRVFWKDKSAGGAAGIGHLAVDLERVLGLGLKGILSQVEERRNAGSFEERIYRQSMGICLQAVMDWAKRYARQAESLAQSQRDPLLKRLLQRVASACQRVPAYPARDLFEALQSILLCHLAVAVEGHGMSVSLGLLDRALLPLFRKGGHPADTKALFAGFMLKLASNSIFGRGSKTQAITLGGPCDGDPETIQALRLAFLDAVDFLRVGDPQVFLRWGKEGDPVVQRRAVELIASGLGMPLLIQDEPTIQGLCEAGIPRKEAADFCVIGCNELGIPGRLMTSATAKGGTVQYVFLLERVLMETPRADLPKDMPSLLDAMEEGLYQSMLEARKHGVLHWKRMIERVPTPFTSSLMRGCVERGRDLLEGLPFQVTGVYERGLANAVDALSVLDFLVFRKKTWTLDELIRHLRENWEDKRALAAARQAPRWGEDDPMADRWALALLRMRDRALQRVDAEMREPSHVVCHVVRSLHHLDGARLQASADGRLEGGPVSDSLGPFGGTSRKGPTALLRSVLNIDTVRFYRGGTNLNLSLAPTTPDVVESLVRGFFRDRGQEIQVGVLDPERLQEARERPHLHGDLVVRVAGFCGRFVDLSPLEQDELIARAEAAAKAWRPM